MTSLTLRTITLLGATITTGLATGAFALYAHTVMPGLRRTDDRTFVGAFQALDRAIINPWFMAGGFVGALVFTAGAAVANRHQPAMGWIVAALVLYLIACVVTVAVNVPLNDALKAAGNPDRLVDLAGVRHQFHEARWAAWNLVRTVGIPGCVRMSRLGARAPRPGDGLSVARRHGPPIAQVEAIPIAGSLVPGSPFSRRPAKRRRNAGASSTVTVRSYQPPSSPTSHRSVTSTPAARILVRGASSRYAFGATVNVHAPLPRLANVRARRRLPAACSAATWGRIAGSAAGCAGVPFDGARERAMEAVRTEQPEVVAPSVSGRVPAADE